MGRVTAEEFRAGKDHQVSVGKREAARKRSLDEFDSLEIVHDLTEAFDLAFRLEVNDNAPSTHAPLLHPRGKLRSFRLDQEEIAHREVSDLAVLKGSAKILRLVAPKPTFSNQDVGVTGFTGLDPYPNVIGLDVSLDGSGLIIGGTEQDLDLVQIPD